MSAAPDVLVVGAGVAGLAAATLLAAEGARTTVLEAAPILGGRARSWTDPATGDPVDNGQHLFMGCYRETLTLLDRIGTSGMVRFQERLRVEFVDREGEGGMIDCPSLPGRASVLVGLALYRGLPIAERAGILVAARAAGREESGTNDEDVSTWLQRAGQSPAARRNFWDPLVLATLNERPEVASARALRTVLRLGLLGGPEASRLGWARGGLNELFAAPARSWLQARGGSVRFPAPAGAVRGTCDGVEVELRTGELLRARAAILAVPPTSLLRLLPRSLAGDPALAGVGGLATSPILGVNLWFDRPIAEGPFYALLGTTMQWLFNKSVLLDRAGEREAAIAAGKPAATAGWDARRGGEGEGGVETALRSGGATHHLALVASGARREVERSAEELVRIALGELRELFPGTRRARLLRSLVVKERDATISPAVGWDALRPSARTTDSRIFLAGDWTATGLPPTIESAALSGHGAARAALETL